jgi:fatty acid desaturase
MSVFPGQNATAIISPELPATVVPPRLRSPDDVDFQDLARRVREAGFFNRAPWRAPVRLALIALCYGAGWAALVIVGNSWYELLVAVYMAVVFTQVGFLGHDVGHRQIFRSRRLNRTVGLVCGNLGIGISYDFWVLKHNQHHAHPNEVGSDPDVGPGVISWSPEQVAGKSGLSRAVAKHQAALFFPLTCLEALSLHVASFRALRGKRGRRASIEAILLSTNTLACLVAVFLVLSPLRAVAFVVLQQSLFGLYLGCAFAPNHKGMPMPAPGHGMGFARRQVTTSRNVKGNRALDVVLGGLNYQIEHHLFPSMPMANLRRCQPMVRAYCLSHDMGYCETTLVSSYVTALRHLQSAGRP